MTNPNLFYKHILVLLNIASDYNAHEWTLHRPEAIHK